MKYAMKRTEGIRWDRWRRRIVTRSLEMMVMNGVVRRAEVDPPRYLNDCTDLEADPEASLSSMPSVNLEELSWFTRFSSRQTESPFTHARHTT